MKALTEELESVKAERDGLLSEKNDAQTHSRETEEVQIRLTSLSEEKEDLQSRLKSLSEEKEELREILEVLRQEKQQLQAELEERMEMVH